MAKITVPYIREMKKRREKIVVLTAYTYSIARILDDCLIPVILVGDSVAMTEGGLDTTLPVTMDEMVYHTRVVSRACRNALVVADMPFMSYQASIRDAKTNAGRLVKEGGAGAVKIEGGIRSAQIIKAITAIDIPVMAHIGLTPQSVHMFGGYKVQGKKKKGEEALMRDARSVEEAGAFSVVLECIPARLAGRITKALKIPTIGIGAGPGCDGQVLVVNDMLGMDSTKPAPRFVKRYANLERIIKKAVLDYKKDVGENKFPAKENSY